MTSPIACAIDKLNLTLTGFIAYNLLETLFKGTFKGVMSRMAPLLSHHSSGAKHSLERQKKLLIKRVNRGLPAPSRFPPRFDIKLS